MALTNENRSEATNILPCKHSFLSRESTLEIVIFTNFIIFHFFSMNEERRDKILKKERIKKSIAFITHRYSYNNL